MANTYHMPPDTREEEKIVGGYLNKTQLIWIVLGGGIGIILGTIAFSIIGICGFILLFPPLGIGIRFATKTVENMTLFQYLRYQHKFKKKTKNYVNYGHHDDLFFTGGESMDN